jgi:hypothetical protein
MRERKRGAVIIGPAWNSCGSHQLFKSQIEACAATGAETYFLAVCPQLNLIGEAEGWWAYYLRMTPDITATMRGEAKVRSVSKWRPTMFFNERKARSRTMSFWRTMPARLAEIPSSLRRFARTHDVDAVICNHYFNLPIAEKVSRWAGGAKIICETQDIQSRHMIISNPTHPLTGAPGDYDSYFADEIACSLTAHQFIHLNEEEFNVMQHALPDRKHHLIYPSLPRAPRRPEGLECDLDFVIVASANPPNYRSLKWFLSEVWDDELNAKATLSIVGNIDYMFGHDGDEWLTRYGAIFAGRVEELSTWYHRARTVLAPTIDGQGISIKTIEALSYGRPFVFSPLALRGFAHHPLAACMAGRCSTAEEFKAALWRRLGSGRRQPFEVNQPALELYEALFACNAYQRRFRELLLGAQPVDAAAERELVYRSSWN